MGVPVIQIEPLRVYRNVVVAALGRWRRRRGRRTTSLRKVGGSRCSRDGRLNRGMSSLNRYCGGAKPSPSNSMKLPRVRPHRRGPPRFETLGRLSRVDRTDRHIVPVEAVGDHRRHFPSLPWTRFAITVCGVRRKRRRASKSRFLVPQALGLLQTVMISSV